MLQQILKDMYVDPDVLDGLNEDQKKTLFMKMRQEQVRRWEEWEEKLQRDGGDLVKAKPRKPNSKSVSWLLGHDGDVSVVVIREVDELTSAFICPRSGEKKSPPLQSNKCHSNIPKNKTATDVKSEVESVSLQTQPEVSSDVTGQKEEEKSTLLPLVVSAAEGSAPTEAKKLDPMAAEEKWAPQASICSRSSARVSSVMVGPASANPTPGCVNTQPCISNPRLATSAPSSSSSSSTVKPNSGGQEPPKPQEAQDRKGVGASGTSRRPDSTESGTPGTAPACAGRGRVAQLMKTFSGDTPTQTTSRGIKPPLPTKPSHLRLTTR
uniref:SH2 domain containing 4B n=1 Tax=Iconisemion striatum TaxID=60296 RepID=A0A1A7W9D1_9TELE